MPLVDDVAPLQATLDDYAERYRQAWRAMAAAKLGLRSFDEDRGDDALVVDLFETLAAEETDMTIFFRRLAALRVEDPEATDRLAAVRDAFYAPDDLPDEHARRVRSWLKRYVERCRHDARADAERQSAMDAVNPKYVLRNYLAQLAIDAIDQKDDPSVLAALQDTLRRPYDEQPEREAFAAKRPEWARHRPGCSTLSCSS